jgi:hypothetical protein
MATNLKISQGVLNRLRGSIVFPDFGSLNITAPYMGKNMIVVSIEGNIVNQIPTGTGVVNSPEPYVPVGISVILLRTQQLAADWFNKALTNSKVGSGTVHSDTAAFPAMQLDDLVIRHIDPGPYNGSGPDVNLTLGGILYVNNDLWSFA